MTGHEDGSVCVWPADFSVVLLEAHHDAPIKSVDVSQDGMTVLTATRAVSQYKVGVVKGEPSLLRHSVGDSRCVRCRQ